jgi:AcrR family transcriptional regulator
MAVAQTDGRRLRRAQNREAVLDALVELFDEGEYTPGTTKIAERAGISPRSLFRYFDDVDDLHRAAIERSRLTAAPLTAMDIDPHAPTAQKIVAFVEARVRLHEAVGNAERATRLSAHRHDVIAAQLREGRAFFRSQARDVFAPELADDDGALLAAVDALTSIETYDLYRTTHRLSRARAIGALVTALTAVLEHEGTPLRPRRDT